MTIRESIERIVDQKLPIQTIVGKVKSVNEDDMICDISVEGSADLLDVRLRAVIDGQETGILIVPKKGSYVLVSLIDNKPESAFISAYSEIEKIHLMVDEIWLGGDGYSIVKAEELKTELNKMTARIDLLYNAINAGTPGGAPDAGAALATSMKAVVAAEPPKENFSSIDNQNVKHG